ncbi:MAG: CdaR family protein [Gemmatimonadales bacterium]
MSLRTALTTNLPLKLTSLALSVFLWLLAASEEPASALLQVEMTVRPPAGRTVIRPPEELRALVVGPRRELLKLSAAPVRLTRILPDTVEGDEVSLALSPGELEIPRGVNVHVQDLQPRAVTVMLDSTSQRVVQVHPVVHLRPESGFAVAAVSVTPARVRLLGPLQRLRAFDSISTEPIEISPAEAPVEQVSSLDTSGLGSVRVSPARVRVRVDVEADGERKLAGVPVSLPSAAAAMVRPEQETVEVSVHGPAGRLAALVAESVLVVVDWHGQPEPRRAPFRVPLRALVPRGLVGKVTPDSVNLVRRGPRG